MALQETNKIKKIYLKIFLYTVGILGIISINVQNAFAAPKRALPVVSTTPVAQSQIVMRNKDKIYLNLDRPNDSFKDKEKPIEISKKKKIQHTPDNLINYPSSIWTNNRNESIFTRKLAIALDLNPNKAELKAIEMEDLFKEKVLKLSQTLKHYVDIENGLSFDLANQIVAKTDKLLYNNQAFQDICLVRAYYTFLFHLQTDLPKEDAVLLALQEKLRTFMDCRILLREEALKIALNEQKTILNNQKKSRNTSGTNANKKIDQLVLEGTECCILITLTQFSIISILPSEGELILAGMHAIKNNAVLDIVNGVFAILQIDPTMGSIMGLETSSLETEAKMQIAVTSFLSQEQNNLLNN